LRFPEEFSRRTLKRPSRRKEKKKAKEKIVRAKEGNRVLEVGIG